MLITLILYILQGRANAQQYSYDSSNFTNLQNQVDEVKGVMKNNIEQILKRGENLDELADKSSNLESTVNLFNQIPLILPHIDSKKFKRIKFLSINKRGTQIKRFYMFKI